MVTTGPGNMGIQRSHQVSFTLTRLETKPYPLGDGLRETELMSMQFGNEDELEVLETLAEYLDLRIGKLRQAASQAAMVWNFEKLMRVTSGLAPFVEGVDMTPGQIVNRGLLDPRFTNVRDSLTDFECIEWLVEKYVTPVLEKKEEVLARVNAEKVLGEVDTDPRKMERADDTVQIPVLRNEYPADEVVEKYFEALPDSIHK